MQAGKSAIISLSGGAGLNLPAENNKNTKDPAGAFRPGWRNVMGDWLEKLERKYYRYSIPNLPAILAGGQVAVLVILLLFRSDIGNYLMLDRAAILHGQIWRLITFVFIPQGTVGSSISLVLTLLQIYFLYFAGKALENAWGQFKLTVFTLAGMLGCILACLLLPGASVLSQLYGMIAMSAIFSLVTLPVEYNASARALEWLQVSRTMQGAQLAQAKEALSWAARTYLVAALSAIASVLYYVFLILGRRD